MFESVRFVGLALAVLTWAGEAACASGVLYFVDVFRPTFKDGAIRRINTKGGELETLVKADGGLRGLAVDSGADSMYWSNVDGQVIYRAHLDGNRPRKIITSGLSFPNALALDNAADHLFWGDQTATCIGRAMLNGVGAAPWLTTPFHVGLAVDTVHGKLYWTCYTGPTTGSIMQANLDGSGANTVLSGVGKPAYLALDPTGGRMYWTDYVNDVVRRANLDGTGVEDLYVVGSNLNPGAITLDLAKGKVYWAQDTSGNRDNIMRMNLDGSNPETVAGPFGLITALCLVPEPLGTGMRRELDHYLWLAGQYRVWRDDPKAQIGTELRDMFSNPALNVGAELEALLPAVRDKARKWEP